MNSIQLERPSAGQLQVPGITAAALAAYLRGQSTESSGRYLAYCPVCVGPQRTLHIGTETEGGAPLAICTYCAADIEAVLASLFEVTLFEVPLFEVRETPSAASDARFQTTEQDFKENSFKEDNEDIDWTKTDIDVRVEAENALSLYLRHAYDASSYEDTDRWRSPMFSFARKAKAHPALRQLSSAEALSMVQRMANTWSEPPFGMFEEDDKVDFMHSWDAIRHPSQDILEEAAELADQYPIIPKIQRGMLYGRFLSIARALQVIMGASPIMLPVEKMAAALGCSARTVSSLRQFALSDGYLQIVQKHSLRKAATRFEFISLTGGDAK